MTLNSSEAHKLWSCLCSLYRHVTFASFLKQQVSLSGILRTSIISVLSCAPPPAFTVSVILLCVGTGLSLYYASVQSLLQGELYLWWGCCSGVLCAGVPEAVLKDLKAISKLCGGKEDTCQKLEWGQSSLHCLAWPSLQNVERSVPSCVCLTFQRQRMPVPPLCSKLASKWPALIQRWCA